MAEFNAEKWRSTINRTSNGIEVIIPSRKHFLRILFLGGWLVFWCFAEVIVIGKILNPESKALACTFLTVWLIIWTAGGALAIYVLLWNLMGREVVRINGKELHLLKECLFFSIINKYDLRRINGLRPATGTSPTVEPINSPESILDNTLEVTPEESLEFWGLTGGTVAFDYDVYNTRRFGIGLDKAEAERIVSRIKERFQNL